MSDGHDKDIIKTYERRTIYTRALSKSLESFISYTEKSIDNVMSSGLQPIADVTSLDRVIVFRIFGITSNTAGEIYRWDKAKGGTVPVDPALKELPVTAALKRWISIVSKDNCLGLRRSEFREDEAAFLSPRGVMSILIVPVFIEREFWGVVTFHDNTNERDFDEDCISLLRSTAQLCANTIIREEKTKTVDQAMEELKRREKMTDTLNKASLIFLSQSEEKFEDTMAAGAHLIADAADIDKLAIYRSNMAPDDLQLSRVYSWDRSSGSTTETINAFSNIFYEQLTPKWKEFLADGNYVNSPTKLLPKIEAAALQSYGIKSAAVIPVYINSDFWGFALFGDIHNERCFDKDIIEMMHSAAFLFVNAFIHSDMEQTVSGQNLFHYALNHISAILLQADIDNFKDNLLRSMGIMAGAVDVDRVYIWKNFIKDGQLYCSQLYEWSEGVESQLNCGLTIEMSYSDIVPEWELLLLRGECINGIVREMSDKVKAVLNPQGILSILIEPVFLQSQFWGFVGFDDCHKERVFSENEEMILRAANQLIANAVIRNEMEHKAADEDVLSRVMFDTAPIGLTRYDENLNFVDCNEAILKMYDVTKEYYLDHIFEFMPEYQPNGQKTVDMLADVMKRALSGETMTFEWMQNTLNGEPIPCELMLTRARYNGKYIGLGYMYDLRNIKKMEKNIQWLETEKDKIYYDPLTGIYNRRYFDENLKQCLHSLSRSGDVLSLMMIDIDFFKNYNDTYGHKEGDKCLKTIAEALTNTITRADDFVARYGGEEFVIVLPNTDEHGVRIIADKLLKNVQECNIPHKSSSVANYVTVSIGATTGRADQMYTEEDYIQCADEMLYKSKQEGRNTFNYKSL